MLGLWASMVRTSTTTGVDWIRCCWTGRACVWIWSKNHYQGSILPIANLLATLFYLIAEWMHAHPLSIAQRACGLHKNAPGRALRQRRKLWVDDKDFEPEMFESNKWMYFLLRQTVTDARPNLHERSKKLKQLSFIWRAVKKKPNSAATVKEKSRFQDSLYQINLECNLQKVQLRLVHKLWHAAHR